MRKIGRALGMVGVVVGVFAGRAALADLPPPAGMNRVHYSFRVTGSSKDVVLVAYPAYVSEGGSVLKLTPEKDVVMFQGYTPGVYSLPEADAAALAGKSGDEVDKVLSAKGHRCIGKVPRVFTIASDTKIQQMVDVFRIEASPTDCRASLAKTIYRGEGGAEGEGGLDASGHRTPPAPFSAGDLPALPDLLGTPAAPNNNPASTAPAPTAPASAGPTPPASTSAAAPPPAPHAGCAGCATPVSPASGGGALALLSLGAALVCRRGATRRKRSVKAR